MSSLQHAVLRAALVFLLRALGIVCVCAFMVYIVEHNYKLRVLAGWGIVALVLLNWLIPASVRALLPRLILYAILLGAAGGLIAGASAAILCAMAVAVFFMIAALRNQLIALRAKVQADSPAAEQPGAPGTGP